MDIMSKYGEYVLMTDSTCDLPSELTEKLGLEVIPMVFLMEEKAYKHYLDAREMSLEEFYNKLGKGIQSQTTQISYNSYIEYFDDFLRRGLDIVYISFTSGLSGTYNTAGIAARDILEKYPDRTIDIVDSACASVGQGMLMYLVGSKYTKDKPTSSEIIAYAEEMKLSVCHWFVVDDIDQLKRGGRISGVTATFAKALQIKPMLSLDNDGKLLTVGKVRGANNVQSALVKKLERDGENLKSQTVIVGHANYPEGAKELKKRLKGIVKDVIIAEIGPVIGTHVGSGMLALTFVGERNFEM